MPAKRLRPHALPGVTYRMPTSCGRIYVTITKDGLRPPLRGLRPLRQGRSLRRRNFDGMTKLISYALRSGIVCTYGRNTCLNAVAEALEDLLAPPTARAKAAKGNPHPHRSSPAIT